VYLAAVAFSAWPEQSTEPGDAATGGDTPDDGEPAANDQPGRSDVSPPPPRSDHWPETYAHAVPVDPQASDVVQPAITLLRGSSQVLRALRPLKRKVPSQHDGDVVLDADATAEQAIQLDGVWLPVMKPAVTRWLDLTLVVDCGPSMALWRQTVTAFISLLQQLGAFRTIQLRRLDTHRPGSGEPGVPVLRGGTPLTSSRSPAELLDLSGRRILLVVTDGASESWRQGLVNPMLACWASAMPVAVVHLLSQRLWTRSLTLHRARLTVPAPVRPNRDWGVELSDAWLEPELQAALRPGDAAIPVFELDARWLGHWARLITGSHGPRPVDATVLLAGDTPTQNSTPAAAGEPSAHERVHHFHAIASPPAFRLATLLAALPVDLRVARHVQAELVPESGPDHLAEVLTSGLLRPSGSDQSWDSVKFDIPEAVRAELLGGARRSETARAVRITAERFGDQVGGLSRLRDALDDPDRTPDPTYTAETAEEIAIERTVMSALSGPYRSRADRFDRVRSQGHPHPSIDPPSEPLQPVGQDRRAGGGAPPWAPVESEPIASESMPDRADLADAPATTSIVAHKSPAVAPASDESMFGRGPGDTAVPPVSSLPSRASAPPLRKVGSVPLIWGNVPPRNPNFTGREDLIDQLSQRLTAGSTTAVLPAALHGMGGIGKTQMAVEYVHRHLDDYDLVWWIQATHVAQIRAGLTELAGQLGLPGGAEANTAVPAVREALRLGNPFSRWLLVFDAAESPEQVRPFFPTNGPGEILITSRNPDWASVASPIEINVFKRAESIELLRRRGPEFDDADADLLAERLGDLPLAIEQAAAWRAETGMPVDEYLRLFDEKVAEILDTSAPADYEVSVAAAWNVSFDELSNRNPAAHQLLQVCAFYAPEPISRDLFSGVRGVSVSPELDRALRDPIQLGRAIRDISRYGLAKIDYRHNSLLLHRLVQLVLRNRMPATVRATMQHGAHLLLANLDPGQPASSQQWPRYQAILPHVYAADAVECDDAWVRQLVINLMFFLYHFGDHEEALRLAQQAFESWKSQLGETDAQTLVAAERYGFYLWELGRYAEASMLNDRTLELRRQASGENAEETLFAQIAVVADLKAKGDFAATKKLTGEVLQRARGLFGLDDPTTLTAAHTHAISLRFTGEYLQALALDEETHRRRVEVLGYDHANTLSTYSAMLLDRRESGDYAGARAGYEKHAEYLRQLFGDDKAATLRVYSYLAVSRRKDGDHAGALELSTRMLERFRTRYGDGYPAVMGAALSHSIDVRQNNDLESARSLGEQAFDRYRRLLGEHHPHTLAAALDLAATLRMIGDSAGARQLDERVFEQFRAVLGPDHPYAIVSTINLATDLSAAGETEAAHELGVEALERADRAFGPEHATTLAANLNLALDLRTLGRKQEAETKYADVLTGYRQVLGEAHPATIDAAKGIRANCDVDPLPF
jgi:tetratricopeptide (TPR) repeat protein